MTLDLRVPSFLARPVDDAPRPGVVVLHEAGGISTQLMRFSERLAAQGYLVLAPDLFRRVGGPEAAPYQELVQSLDNDELRADLTEVIEALRAHGATSVGITGFCMGGSMSYRAATWGLGLACSAPFYGSFIPRELGEPVCPIRIFFGEADEWSSAEEMEALRAHHGDDVVWYPGAPHGFMRDGSPSYDEVAAADAWSRLLAFFAEHLA